MPSPRFHTKDGWLTAYGLACGYIEDRVCPTGRVRMHMEHGVYHVRKFTRDNKRIAWEVRRSLRLARSEFRKQLRSRNDGSR